MIYPSTISAIVLVHRRGRGGEGHQLIGVSGSISRLPLFQIWHLGYIKRVKLKTHSIGDGEGQATKGTHSGGRLLSNV